MKIENIKLPVKILLWSFTLIPTLFFPIFGDISIFILAGKTIAQGGILYHDIIDLKPPLFYYIFTGIYYLVGSGELGLRLFFFVYQLITLIFFYFLIKKTTNQENIAFVSSLLFGVLYTSLGYAVTISPEILSFLPLSILLYANIFNKSKYNRILIQGLMIGIILNIKFSLIIICIPFFFEFLLNKNENYSKRVVNFSLLILIVLVVTGVSFLPLINHNSYEGFSSVVRYLSFYSNIPNIDFSFFKNAISGTNIFLGDNISIVILVLSVICFANYFKNDTVNIKKENNKLFELLFLISFLMIIGVIIERKLTVFHFSRLLLPISYFSGFGLVLIINWIKDNWQLVNKINKAFIITLMIIGIIFSPLSRWVNQLRPSYFYFTDRAKYESFFELKGDYAHIYSTYHKISDYIYKNIPKGKKIIVVSVGGNVINYLTPDYIHSVFTQSVFYLNNYNFIKWKEVFKQELNSADYLIIHTKDGDPLLGFNTSSSLESLQIDSTYNNILNTKFQLDKSIKPFNIYSRKSN